MLNMTPAQLQARLAEPGNDPLLLDVREAWEFDICALPGSKLVPMRRIPESLDSLDPEQEIVVICHHGIRSRQVAFYLEQQGYSNIINLAGGLDAWARELDPQMATY
jgi:rhodanese-related sulfurtransferase